MVFDTWLLSYTKYVVLLFIIIFSFNLCYGGYGNPLKTQTTFDFQEGKKSLYEAIASDIKNSWEALRKIEESVCEINPDDIPKKKPKGYKMNEIVSVEWTGPLHQFVKKLCEKYEYKFDLRRANAHHDIDC